MKTVRLSSDYQVTIPKDIREALDLRPGQKMRIVELEGRIELIPDRDITGWRAFVKGINVEFTKESDRK